jgi:hypothetical protein
MKGLRNLFLLGVLYAKTLSIMSCLSETWADFISGFLPFQTQREVRSELENFMSLLLSSSFDVTRPLNSKFSVDSNIKRCRRHRTDLCNFERGIGMGTRRVLGNFLRNLWDETLIEVRRLLRLFKHDDFCRLWRLSKIFCTSKHSNDFSQWLTRSKLLEVVVDSSIIVQSNGKCSKTSVNSRDCVNWQLAIVVSSLYFF